MNAIIVGILCSIIIRSLHVVMLNTVTVELFMANAADTSVAGMLLDG